MATWPTGSCKLKRWMISHTDNITEQCSKPFIYPFHHVQPKWKVKNHRLSWRKFTVVVGKVHSKTMECTSILQYMATWPTDSYKNDNEGVERKWWHTWTPWQDSSMLRRPQLLSASHTGEAIRLDNKGVTSITHDFWSRGLALEWIGQVRLRVQRLRIYLPNRLCALSTCLWTPSPLENPAWTSLLLWSVINQRVAFLFPGTGIGGFQLSGFHSFCKLVPLQSCVVGNCAHARSFRKLSRWSNTVFTCRRFQFL